MFSLRIAQLRREYNLSGMIGQHLTIPDDETLVMVEGGGYRIDVNCLVNNSIDSLPGHYLPDVVPSRFSSHSSFEVLGELMKQK